MSVQRGADSVHICLWEVALQRAVALSPPFLPSRRQATSGSFFVMGTEAYPPLVMKAAALLVVLMLWINGHRQDFTADGGFELVVGVAAGSTELQKCATLISKHMFPR